MTHCNGLEWRQVFNILKGDPVHTTCGRYSTLFINIYSWIEVKYGLVDKARV